MLSQSRGILREGYKYSLGDVLGGVRLAGHAKGGGVDEINVTADQFGERSFGAVLGKGAQHLLVSLIVHSPDNTRRARSRTKKCSVGASLCLT